MCSILRTTESRVRACFGVDVGTLTRAYERDYIGRELPMELSSRRVRVTIRQAVSVSLGSLVEIRGSAVDVKFHYIEIKPQQWNPSRQCRDIVMAHTSCVQVQPTTG